MEVKIKIPISFRRFTGGIKVLSSITLKDLVDIYKNKKKRKK